jgi:hypothetical protein
MAVPRGALDVVATVAVIFGMGPTAPTQAERPVAQLGRYGAMTLRKSTVA